MGCPLPPYIKEWRRGGPALSMARQGGVLLLVGVGPQLGGGKKWGGRRKGGRRPPSPSPIRTRGRRRAAHLWQPLSLSPLRPIWPITSPGRVPVTLQLSGFLRNHPEHYRCPNIAVQYINLYVSAISRLLVMSVITSGTLN